MRWHHSARRRRRRRSAARRGEEPPRRRGSEEEEKGGRKEKGGGSSCEAASHGKGTKQAVLQPLGFAVLPGRTAAAVLARPWAAGGVGAGRLRSAPVTEGRGGGEWAWGLKWRREPC